MTQYVDIFHNQTIQTNFRTIQTNFQTISYYFICILPLTFNRNQPARFFSSLRTRENIILCMSDNNNDSAHIQNYQSSSAVHYSPNMTKPHPQQSQQQQQQSVDHPPSPPAVPVVVQEVLAAVPPPTIPSTTDNNTNNDDSNNESNVLFGSTITNVFDAIHEALRRVIRVETLKLPFPESDDNDTNEEDCTDKPDELTANGTVTNNSGRSSMGGGGREAMTSILLSAYSRHVDLAEVYAKRYLFGFPKEEFTGRKKRRRMVEAYVKEWERLDNSKDDGNRKMEEDCSSSVVEEVGEPIVPLVDSSTSTHQSNDEPNEQQQEQDPAIPSSTSKIPTPQQITTLDTELQTLRHKLHTLTSSHTQLQSQLSSLRTIHNSTQLTTEVIQRHLDNDGVRGLTEGVVVSGREDLLDLFVVGEEAMERMNEDDSGGGATAGGGRVDGETMEFGEAMKRKALEASRSMPPKKRLTMKEEFVNRQEDGLEISNNGTNGSSYGGRIVSNLFQKK